MRSRLPVPDPQRIERLARELIAHPSATGSEGEARLGAWLHARLSRLPYFARHPDRLQRVAVAGAWERHAVLAWVAGGMPGDAVLLLGHYDTAGFDDYGDLADLACHPDRLRAALSERPAELPDDAARDLASHDWLWGRGSADMKAGVAVLLALVEELAADPSRLRGHAVLCLVPDGEAGSRGLLTALPALAELAERGRFRFAAVIHAGAAGPLYPGDPHRYVYLGSAGRLVPALYVRAQWAHAGDPLAAVDAAFLAAGLTRRLAWAGELCDATAWPAIPELDLPEREAAPPPAPLEQVIAADRYGMRPPHEAACCYSISTLERSPAAAAMRLREAASAALRDTLHLLHARRHRWSQVAGLPPPPPPPALRVVTLAELRQEVARRRGPRALEAWAAEAAQLPEPDLRLACLEAVRQLARLLPTGEPLAVLYYGGGWLPRTVVDPGTPAGARVVAALRAALDEMRGAFPDVRLAVRRYYPHASDLSLVCPGPDDERLEEFAALMPAWGTRYRLDRSWALQLGAPGVRIGPYGKDPRTPTERVHRGYAFTVLPRLIAATVARLLDAPSR